MAHTVIHSLRQILAPGSLPLFTSDGFNLSFSAALRSCWTLAPGGSERAERASLAGGSGVDLRAGEEKLPMPQAGSAHPPHAPLDTSRAHRCEAWVRLLWSAESSLYRASESPRASWGGSAGTPHLGDVEARSTPARSPGMVARVFPCCASSRIAAGSVRAAGSREVASWWHHATASVPKLWQPAEPPEGGRRASCSLAPSLRFPHKSHRSQMGVLCHVARMMVKVPAEAVGWGLTPGSDGLSGLPTDEKTSPKRICRGC
jgi:hypothetical protein